jgi:hypothetical protein
MTTPEEYTLTIRAQRSDMAPAIRLRRVLKNLLRQYAFRIVKVSETTPQLPPVPWPAEGQQQVG